MIDHIPTNEELTSGLTPDNDATSLQVGSPTAISTKTEQETQSVPYKADDFEDEITEELDTGEYTYKKGIALFSNEIAHTLNRISQSVMGVEDKASMLNVVREILLHGNFDGYDVDQKVPGESDHQAEHSKAVKRRTWAGVYERNPFVAEQLASQQIFGFHATASGAMLGILEHGLLPGVEVRGRDLATNGEWDFETEVRQATISVADLDDVVKLASYAGLGLPITPDVLDKMIQANVGLLEEAGGERLRKTLTVRIEEQKRLLRKIQESPDALENFLYMANIPMLWGISRDIETKRHVVKVSAGETRIQGSVEPEDCRVVVVPREKMDYIRKVAEKVGHPIIVLPMEDILVKIIPPRADGSAPGHELRYVYGEGLEEKWTTKKE